MGSEGSCVGEVWVALGGGGGGQVVDGSWGVVAVRGITSPP